MWIWVNMPVCTWQYGTFFVPPLFFWNAFLRNWGGTRPWVRCQEWVVWGVATKITGQSCSLKIEIKICEQCLAVTWELMVRAPHPHNGRQCFARITRRMAGCFQILICFMSIGWWLVSGASLVDDANLHTGSWNSELWLRITCSWTHKYNHCQCYIVSWLKFSSTRPSCVRTLRKGAQEIVHRYTTFFADIQKKNFQFVICSRGTTVSSAMDPMSCGCIKVIILDPKITVNSLLLEMGSWRILGRLCLHRIFSQQVWKWLCGRAKACATTEFREAGEGRSLREV